MTVPAVPSATSGPAATRGRAAAARVADAADTDELPVIAAAPAPESTGPEIDGPDFAGPEFDGIESGFDGIESGFAGLDFEPVQHEAEPLESDADPEPGSAAALAGRAWLQHPAGLLLAALTGGGLAYAFDASARVALIAVAVVQGLLILSWVFGTGVPGRIGALVLGAGTATAADLVVTHWRSEVGPLVGVLGLSMVAMFGHQLLRGRWRVNVVESLSYIAVLLVATTALASLIELRHQVDGPAMTIAVLLCTTAALVAGHLVDWIWDPLRFDPDVNRGLLGVVAAVIAGAAVTAVRLRRSVEFTDQRAVLLGAAIALITALFAVAVAFIAQTDGRPTGRVARASRPLAGVLLVFALTSPIAYLLCLALRG